VTNVGGRSVGGGHAGDKNSDSAAARKKAMDYLARREHGRVELINKLTNSGFDLNSAETAVGQLIEDGLQSDERFIATFIQSRINQGKGPVRIRAELRDRGLEDGLIADGLRAADAVWYALVHEVREKKFGPERPAGFKEKARQMRFLQYRGFEPDHIQAAVSVDTDSA